MGDSSFNRSLPRLTGKQATKDLESKAHGLCKPLNSRPVSLARIDRNAPKDVATSGNPRGVMNPSRFQTGSSSKTRATSLTQHNKYSRFDADGCSCSSQGKGRSISQAITTKSKHTGMTEVGQTRRSQNGEVSLRSLNPQKLYDIRPVIPAQQAEVVSMARAMNREHFAPRLHNLFNPEREAAMEAIESGIYIGWRCPEFNYDCIRVGSNSKCFCGHVLTSHSRKERKERARVCESVNCSCKDFAFMPSRPEDVGEWWLPKRPGFDVSKWRAKCRCKHAHESHDPNGRRQCLVKGCTCFSFESNFLCCACDRHWEDHQTFFDSADVRKANGLPYGEHYLPFHELPALRNIVLTGKEDDSSIYEGLANGPYAIPRSNPTALARQLKKQ